MDGSPSEQVEPVAAESPELLRLRADIDAADTELLALLNRRASLSLAVGKLKAETGDPVFRPVREEAVMSRLVRANPGPLTEGHLRAVYREILSSSRALQRTSRVAFLGPEGTFSHMACLEYFGHGVACAPMPHLADVFTAVTRRDCELGIVPLENSMHGTVVQTLDLFVDHDLFIQAECYNQIRLSIMSREHSLADVQVVCSHPQPLGQCSAWLRRHLPGAERVSMESTAAAAHRAAQEPHSAAIGHAGLAGRLGLRVLQTGIEDARDNWTRFFIIGPAPARPKGADKSSVIFALADKPGSLSTVLAVFARAHINISKLESRPLREERWKYLFFADLDCDISDARHAAVLDELRNHCLRLRLLGSYPAGQHIETFSEEQLF